LVDRIGTYAEFGRRIEGITGKGGDGRPGSFKHIGFDDYVRATKPLTGGSGSAVGIGYVAGNIIDGEAPRGTAGSDTIADLVEQALTDDSIKALVVRIDSPGGSVTASEKIRQAL